MFRPLDVASSVAATLARGASARAADGLGARPDARLVLYDFEGCPYCRKAREALTVLDLEAEIRPCPKGGPRFREELRQRGGKAQFPYLIDANTGTEMYESDAIVAYLYERYGKGSAPALLSGGILNDVSSTLASALRGGAGVRYRSARPPEQLLELYSFEASPFCRIVRESLCVLELPYVLHNVAVNSPSRAAFVKRSGRMQVPWLYDPNSDRALFESADIVRYLEETYAT